MNQELCTIREIRATSAGSAKPVEGESKFPERQYSKSRKPGEPMVLVMTVGNFFKQYCLEGDYYYYYYYYYFNRNVYNFYS